MIKVSAELDVMTGIGNFVSCMVCIMLNVANYMSYCTEVVVRMDAVKVHWPVWQVARDGLHFERTSLCSLMILIDDYLSHDS